MDSEKILQISGESNKFSIFGLGNPGSVYSQTRHNIGFMVIDELYRILNIREFQERKNYIIAQGEYRNKKIDLIKPVTFMNMSGLAVKEYLDDEKLTLENLLIILDDINLDFGMLRIRAKGSDGGHNGLHSIIYHTETEEFARLRVGIRNQDLLESYRKNINYDLADYVLSVFTDAELHNLNKIIKSACEAVLCFISDGIKQTMNLFNRNILTPPQ